MRAPTYKPVRRYGINMTPMIDVVFLLIIFFLVSSHLAKQESQLELKLPVAASGDDDINQEQPRITVNVKADGTLWVNGKSVARQNLTDLLAATASSTADQNIEVRVRGSRNATYASVEPIMLACTEAGIWNVTYAVYREDPQ